MLINEINAQIPSAMKNQDTVRLNTLRNIKKALVDAQVAVSKDYELTKDEEDKILLKMVSQLEEGISEFTKANRKDLADEYVAQLNVIKEFAPKIASDDEVEALTREVIKDYMASKGESYTISMRDMKPIMTEVKKTYPTANGKVISEVIKSLA